MTVPAGILERPPVLGVKRVIFQQGGKYDAKYGNVDQCAIRGYAELRKVDHPDYQGK